MRRQVHGRRQPRPAPGGAPQGEWGPGTRKGIPVGCWGVPVGCWSSSSRAEAAPAIGSQHLWVQVAGHSPCVHHPLFRSILGAALPYFGHMLEVFLLVGAAGASAPFLAVPAPRGSRQGGVCAPQGVLAAGSRGGIQQPVMQGRSRTTQSYRRSAPRKVPLPVFFWLSTPLASPSRRGAQGRCLSTARLDVALAPSR